MSAETDDISRIQDEDILRKMWQDTEDFGKKKEIRAHMYKVREARLKDFYNSSDITNEAHKTSKTQISNTNKSNMTTHADNLADDSFLSLKSKEIRDSESPTRDVGYRSLGKLQDQGWTITSTNERLNDGKTEATSIKAHTSGTQSINGGKLDFAAQHEQKASVHQDGDDKNFVKSAEAQSSSLLHQEACGGDENSRFKTSTTKSSTSSSYVSESKSTSGQIDQTPSNATIRDHSSEQHSTKIYTKNAPDEIRSHPNYVEGKTKVTQETKTLADGTSVTTTRYETKIGNSTQTAVTKKYSNVASSKSEQKFSTSSSSSHSYQQSSSNNFLRDSQSRSKDSQKAIEYRIEPVGIVTSERRSSTMSETNTKRKQNKKDDVDYVEFIVEPIIKTRTDENSSKFSQSSTKVSQDSRKNINDARVVDYVVEPRDVIEIDIKSSDSKTSKDYTKSTSKTEHFSSQQTLNSVSETKNINERRDSSNQITHTTKNIPSETITTTKTTNMITEGAYPREVPDTTYSTNISTNINKEQNTRESQQLTTDNFISSERKHEKDTRESTKIHETTNGREPRGYSPSKEPQSSRRSTDKPHTQPERREPIKPTNSELNQQTKPTEGMYDTTYRSEFTSKKISVEQRAAHDAFARSLRAVTPERVRSSASPEKTRFPSRSSPERRSERGRSPKKAPEKFSSTETITYTNRRDAPRKSPTRYINGNGTTLTETNKTDTSTKQTKTTNSYDSSTLTRKNKKIDTSCEYKRNVNDITTDLDIIDYKESTPVRETGRPISLEFSKKPKKVSERSPTSPFNDLANTRQSPMKESPRRSQSPDKPSQDRPKLIRTDTYEERVKQILGITGDTKERRRSSLERSTLTKKSSFKETRSSSNNDFTRSPTSPTKDIRKSPVKEVRKSPVKEVRKSPVEGRPRVSEYPSQTRKSPEKQPLGPYPSRKTPTKESPKIGEFPAQIRKSPERQPLEKYPERKSPVKESPKISEFPAQLRKSPEKLTMEPYPQKELTKKESLQVSEYPSQTRKSPEKQPSERQGPYPSRKTPTKEAPNISEFPVQIRKSPEREPLEKYPERQSPVKESSKISEFPAQLRTSPEKQATEPYPEKKLPSKESPQISEYPSQIRKSPEKQPLERQGPCPSRKTPTKEAPKISEFPAQIRKSPEREPLEKYPERKSPVKESPKISEFPAQLRKSPEKQAVEPYPEKKLPTKESPQISEHPSQIRKSPEEQPWKPYQEKQSPDTESCQINKSPMRKSPEKYPTKTTPVNEGPKISEFPSKISPSLEPYPGTIQPEKPAKSIKSTNQKPKKTRVDSESSTTTEENDDEYIIEENMTKTVDQTLESRVPVEEPMILKKLFSTLCREDEVSTTDKKKATQDLISSEIIQNRLEQEIVSIDDKNQKELSRKGPKPIQKPSQSPAKSTVIPKKPTENKKKPSEVPSKKPSEPLKKPGSKTDVHLVKKSDSNTSVSKTETTKSTIPKEKTLVKTPSKKNIIQTTTTTTKKITTKAISSPSQTTKPSTIPKKTPDVYKTTKTKFIGETEYQQEYGKPTKKPSKPTEKITLYNVENIDKLKKDQSNHIRTNRVDDIVNKKKTSTITTKTHMINGEIAKSGPKVGTKQPSTQKTDVTIKILEPKITSQTKNKDISYKEKVLKSTTSSKHTATVNLNLTTKVIPTPKKSSAIRKTVTTEMTRTKKSKTPIEEPNGYTSSDTDSESITESANNSFVNITSSKKYNNTITDQSIEALPKQPVQDLPRPDLDTTTRMETNTHKATKTVLITDKEGRQFQVVVDLKRSKSSREPTPDRLCPRPLTSDEEDEESLPRYPDQISEPDDGSLKRKPKRLSDIPILETEDTNEFTKITDVSDAKTKISKVDKVEESDESLLSVNKKVQKFLSTAENLNKQPTKEKSKIVERTQYEISENLKSDECLLSVSDKVSKFITTAEQLVSPQSVPERPKTPVCKKYKDEINVSVESKKATLQTNIDEVNNLKNIQKRTSEHIVITDENLEGDECLLSVSDKVTKFLSTAEKLSTNKSVSLAKMDIKSTETDTKSYVKESPRAKSPLKKDSSEPSPERKTKIVTPESSPERRTSPSPTRTPDRRPSNQYTSTEKTEQKCSTVLDFVPTSPKKLPTEDKKPASNCRRPSQEESNISTTRRTSLEDSKTVFSTTSRLRSTESIRKAKALFENMAKEEVKPKQKDILSRPSIFDARRNQTDKPARKSPEKSIEKVGQRPKSPGKIEIAKFRPSSPDKIPEIGASKPRSREHSPTHVPHYMTPLDRNQSPSRTSESSTTKPRSREPSPSATPHYMTPIDRRVESSDITLETNSSKRRSREHSPRGTPHYMTPLDRTVDSPDNTSENTENKPRSREHSPRGIPHYMTAIDRNIDSQDRSSESSLNKTRSREHSLMGIPHYMTPLDRTIDSPDNTSQNSENKPRSREHSPRGIPHYMTAIDRNIDSQDRSSESTTSKPRSREHSPHSMPHYMTPLERSQRPTSPHGDIITKTNSIEVTLKGTDSAIKSTPQSSSTTTERRKSSVTLEKRVTEEEILEIFELEILEELLEKVIGYDLRRAIRTQIRLVKKLISEGTLEQYIIKRNREQEEILLRKNNRRNSSPKRGASPSKTMKDSVSKSTEYTSTYTRKMSPERRHVNNNLQQHTELTDTSRKMQESTEYQSNYTFNTRKSSSDYTRTTKNNVDRVSPMKERSSPAKERASPMRNGTSHLTNGKSPSPSREWISSCNRRASETRTSKTVESTPYGRTTTTKTTEKYPEGTRTTTTKTTENKVLTTLKKPAPQTKSTQDSVPEWVRSRNLRKTTETSAPTSNKRFTSSSTTTTTRKSTTNRSSPMKEVKPTDIITSSYGVGPTDENGTPLFGLKALRAKNNKGETKVQGTVIQSEFYSENGHEPVGQVRVTKYSTDPKDLEQNGVFHKDGTITSVTTTQQFGYDDTPSLKNLTDNRKEICDTSDIITSKTSRINRRGSVKALSQKFIDNAVETLKSERQTTYPKAGLILRTSSFKSSGDEHSTSRESSPVEREVESSVTVRSKKTSSTGETFLTNKSKITGVQDVLTRMKNEEYQEGDSAEDVKARGLLNKFLGAQVMLSGMESHISSKAKTSVTTSPSGTVKKSTTVTTTVTEAGKPTTTTRIFQHPVSEAELETVWEEQTLKLLLEQSSDYEERRFIRVRLRQLMAEQEACTALVDQATKGDSTPSTPTTPTATGLEGESQLLPLLQGLLEAPQNDITPDSGTESGEDQRSGLIQEVQNALEKLSTSLRSDQTDISPERKNSLLTLVSKLQAGLSGNDRRASTQSSGGRFHKRKNRQARHTIGVSKEELAHARKLIEEISLTPSESLITIPVLSKQNSESSVPSNSTNSSYRSIQQAKIKNAVAKPFSSSNSSSAIQTPTEPFEAFDLIFGNDTDSNFEQPTPIKQKSTPNIAQTVQQLHSLNPTNSSDSSIPSTLNRTESVDSNASIKSAFAAVKKAALEKVSSMENTKEYDSPSETEDSSTIKASHKVELPLKDNPVYSKPEHQSIPSSNIEEKSKRFDTNRKLRMKRANTIDIPKPLNFYHDENESDTDQEHDLHRQHKDNYYALRGPIRVGNPNTKNIVPTFQPKTESDKKFLAFINQKNEASDNKGAPWTKDNSIWGNKFGNIKNNFEKAAKNEARSFWKSADDNITSRSNGNQFGPKISRQSARNLQQMFEEKKNGGEKSVPWSAQTNVVTGSLHLRTEPEKHYKVIPQPVPTEPKEPATVNQFSHAAQSAFKPISKKVQSPSNRNSLILSPEGSEIVKSKIKDNSNNESVYLYSPKPLDVLKPTVAPAVTSPTTSKPWAASSGGGRVLSLASSKFEQHVQPEPIKPRKLSKDAHKAFLPQENHHKVERTAPYIAKSTEAKSDHVRKLSGQYEDTQAKPTNQSYQMNTKVTQKTFPPTQFYHNSTAISPKYYAHPNTQQYPSQVQNYSIKYDQPPKTSVISPNLNSYNSQPQNYSMKYDDPQKLSSTIPQTQNYSIKYDQPHKLSSTSSKPLNYSIRYDQPVSQTPPNKVQPQNYSIRYDNPQKQPPIQHPAAKDIDTNPIHYDKPQKQSTTHQHVVKNINTEPKELHNPHKVQDTEYTSTMEFKPQQKVSPMEQRPKLQTQTSNESVHEYLAVSSRVMTGPVAQTATTVRQKSPMSRNDHDMEAALGLKNALEKVNNNQGTNQKKTYQRSSDSFKVNKPQTHPDVKPIQRSSDSFKVKQSSNSAFAQVQAQTDSKLAFDSFKYKSNHPQRSDTVNHNTAQNSNASTNHSSFKFRTGLDESKNCGVVKPMQQIKTNQVFNNVSKPREKLQINEKGQSVVTGHFHIPVINVKSPESPRPPTHAQVLSKSDSWHQICMETQKPGQKQSQTVVKSKSSHSLALPKLFEAGMSKDEMLSKRKAMEAFLTGGKSPIEGNKLVKKTSINRVKTSEKVSASNSSRGFTSGLARSRTLPDMIVPELLDESNVDAAFEELLKTS